MTLEESLTLIRQEVKAAVVERFNSHGVTAGLAVIVLESVLNDYNEAYIKQILSEKLAKEIEDAKAKKEESNPEEKEE